MIESENNMTDGNLTQKEIIQLLLHNAQHMATREEVKSDIKELKFELKEDNKELKKSILEMETSLRDDMSKIETSLRGDMSKMETSFKIDMLNLSKRLDKFMFWTLGLVTTSTFLILGFIYKLTIK